MSGVKLLAINFTNANYNFELHYLPTNDEKICLGILTPCLFICTRVGPRVPSGWIKRYMPCLSDHLWRDWMKDRAFLVLW